MTPIKCLSSYCTTSLLEWRNAEDAPLLKGTKRVTSEITFVLLNVVALVETAVYGVFALISVVLLPFTEGPFVTFVKCLESSSFTWVWTVRSLIFNPSEAKMLTRESEVRRALQPELGFRVYRTEDKNEIEVTPPETGVDLLVDFVFAEMDLKTADLFKELEAKVVPLMLAKVVFLYTVGVLSYAPIPSYLNEETQGAIQALRFLYRGRNVTGPFVDLFNSHKKFKVGLDQDHPEKPLLRAIIGASNHEMQQSELLTQCWGAAAARIRRG